jgi:energy-coupling factor transport system permease protein
MNSYLDKETYLHKLDVRTKLILFVLALVPLFMFNDPLYLLALLGLLLAGILPAKLPVKQIMNTIKRIDMLYGEYGKTRP